MKTSDPVSNRVVMVNRTIRASCERVYDALTTADVAKKWWVGEPYVFSELVMEARPGGRFIYAIKNASDGSEYRTYGEYLVCNRPRRILWTNAEGGGTLVSVDLAADGDFTRLNVVHGVYTSEEERDMHQQGWSTSLSNLESLLGT